MVWRFPHHYTHRRSSVNFKVLRLSRILTRHSFTMSTSPSHPFLDLIKKAPVGALSDNLLWGALNHPSLVQAQGVETHGVFRIVLAPVVIGGLLHGLQGVVVPLGVAFVYEEVGSMIRLESTDVGRFQNGAQRPF